MEKSGMQETNRMRKSRTTIRRTHAGDAANIFVRCILSDISDMLGGCSAEQIEQTIPLTEEEFTTLSTCSKKKVIKDRYRMIIEGKIAEIDVFADELKGLVLIDFEFSTENEKSTFKIPDIALADVTQEEFIAGGLLAGKTYNDIAPELERFNYQPIK